MTLWLATIFLLPSLATFYVVSVVVSLGERRRLFGCDAVLHLGVQCLLSGPAHYPARCFGCSRLTPLD